MNTVTVVGAGNIGSHLIPHLARLPGVQRVIIVDPERYEAKNLASQDITAGHVGRPKAVVQARRLRRIRPDIQVDPLVARIEDLPPGRLRSQVILACLDSRRARQHVNELAWRLGMPWIDAGVRAEGLLVRVSVYRPGPDSPCLECAWSENDYAALEQVYPCEAEPAQPQATEAPSALGALAAALQALECRRLLAGDCTMAGREVILAAASHQHYVTTLRRNASCRFPHEVWPAPERIHSVRLTLGEALRLGALSVPGKRFARTLVCRHCGRRRSTLRLLGDGRLRTTRCRCGGRMTAAGFDLVERLEGELPERLLRQSLAGLGFRRGEIFRAGESVFEVA